MASSTSSSRGKGGFRDAATGSDYLDPPAERMGLLSWTLAASPGIKWILPAKIRSPRYNDVVFVGSTSIQLREFDERGQLADATAKIDFGTQIIGAKVISAKSEVIPTIDAILNQERDQERFIIKGKPCTNEQPPQIVVLVTANAELVYLYARESHNGKQVKFVYAKRALLAGVSVLEKHLRHIAMDPNFKVMAVASYNTCTVWNLKEVDDIKENIDAWDARKPQSFHPNIEQRMIQIDGHILKMDFLRPSEEEPDKVILLFIVANGADSLILVYWWDTTEPLDQIQPMSGVVQTLPREDRLPLLLIPSHKRRSFVMVTETSAVFYDDIQSPNATRLPVPLSSDEENPHSSLWVQWAKPFRHDRYRSMKEDILLVREDGRLRLISRPIFSSASAATSFSPGVINADVDTAVCMLPGPRRFGGDTLIVGGSMSDGGVFHLPPRQEFSTLQIISNFNPVHDVALLEHGIQKQKQLKSRRTFVTAGKPGVSSLNELRFGSEAQVGLTHPLLDGESVNHLWILENIKHMKLLVLASHIEHTSAVCVNIKTGDLEDIDLLVFPHLMLDTSTLAAGMVELDVRVQISPDRIFAISDTCAPTNYPVDSCISADIDCDSGMFAVTCKSGTEYHTRIGLIRKIHGEISISLSTTRHISEERPLCLTIFELQLGHYLSIGHSSGCVEILSIDPQGHLTLQHKWTSTSSSVCPITSITVLGSPDHQPILLAGTRAGELYVLKITESNQELESVDLIFDRHYQIGATQVSVTNERRHKDGPLGALVQCGSRLDRIVCFQHPHDVDYMLVNVWLSTRNDLTFANPNLLAARSIERPRSVGDVVINDFLVCATRNEVLFARLVEKEQAIPRRLRLNNKGAHLMVHSKFLNKFVIANNPSNPVPARSGVEDKSGPTSKCPTLHVVDPDMISHDGEQEIRTVLGEEDEHVKVLTPWEPTDGRTHYNLLMVGLTNYTHSRLGFISAARLVPGASNVGFKALMRFANKEIHDICAVEHSSLAVSVGREIVLMRLDVSTRKWYDDARFTLPSPGLSLSAQGTAIYVATQSHSTLVLSWCRETKKFEQLMTDRIARNTRTVAPFGKNGDRLLVTSAWDGGTSVLAYSVKKTALNASTPLFEAQIPFDIKHVTSFPTSWTQQHQYAFQGVALDGTVLRFQTLTYNEWKLLRFLELLVHPDPAKPARRQIALLTARLARNFINGTKVQRSTYFNPKKMHIHGDVLKDLVDGGVETLRSLLQNPIKSEDGMSVDEEYTPMLKLETLARPVIGEASDFPAAVIPWVRKMLRATIY